MATVDLSLNLLTSSSFGVACDATWEVGEASCGEGIAGGVVGAPWESAQL